jgi:hypothetical protein
MSASSNPATAGSPTPDHPGMSLAPSPSTAGTANQLPAVAGDQQWPGPQLFALVDAGDPDRVYCYGVDVGTGAFTVRRDPASHQTDFGSWISMQTAFERLDGLAGGPGRLALVVFDSAPAVAMMAMGPGEPALAVAATGELEYRPQRNWLDYLLDSSDRRVTVDRETSSREGDGIARTAGEPGHDPQAAEDDHVQGVKGRTGAQ